MSTSTLKRAGARLSPLYLQVIHPQPLAFAHFAAIFEKAAVAAKMWFGTRWLTFSHFLAKASGWGAQAIQF